MTFALRQLTPGELMTATLAWVADGSPARAVVEHNAATAGLFIPLVDARNKLAEALGSLGADVPVDDATRLDQRHDDLVHGTIAALDAARYFTTDEARRASLLAARKVLFPTGVAIVHASFADEAGQAASRLGSVTPDVRAILASISIDGVTLDARLTELETVGTALAGTVGARAATAAAAAGLPKPKGKVLHAKNHLIEMIRTIESALIASGADVATLTAVMGPIRVQAEAAEARVIGRADAPPPPAPPAPPAA